MKLSKKHEKLLKDEFSFVIEKMARSKTLEQKLYYFSALYNMMRRIYNIEFSTELLFTHFILEKIYKEIIHNIGLLKSGQSIVELQENFDQKMIEYTQELKNNFFDSKLRTDVLHKFVALAYSLSGNGYYLYQKGSLDIF